MHQLLKFPPALSFLLIAIVGVAVAVLGLFVVRRRFPVEQVKENHEVAGIIFSAFGWLYAVIVAFVVFVTWTGYDEASKNMQLEASQALDIFNSADAFTEPVRSQVRQLVIQYAETVGRDELPKMSTEGMPLYSMPPLRRLDELLTTLPRNEIRNSEMYATSLRRLDNLMEYRRLRIFAGVNNVPFFIWLVLLVGGFIMVTDTYFFAMRNVRAQAVLIAGLTVTLTLLLYLIFVLDHPFTGTGRVTDDPLREAIALMREKSR